VRFLYFLVVGEGSGHVQSLILTAILMVTGVMFYAVGVLAQLSGVNRMLLEDVQAYIRSERYGGAAKREKEKRD
jgi:hypothetical protein